MIGRAIDYAYGWTPAHTATFKRAGVRVVLRYVGIPSNPKCIGPAELRSLQAAGLGTGFVYESTALWMLGGATAGAGAAHRSIDYLTKVGGPARPFLYLAADFDVSPSQMGAVLDCLRGAAQVLGAGNVGIYGGLNACSAALARKLAAKAWQTVAWSHGVTEFRACLRQVLGQRWGNLGLAYDTDEMYAANVGQWPAPAPHPAERVTMCVPLAVYRWRILWNAAYPLATRWRCPPSFTPTDNRVKLAVPVPVLASAGAWARGFNSRESWRVP